jgi:hypothetical protein
MSSHLKVSFILRTEMARIRSTARLTNEGGETETAETALISEVMRRSGLVIQEEGEAFPEKDNPNVEAKNVIAKVGSGDEEDNGILSLSKPSHIEFGRSTVKPEDVVLMKKLGYFEKNDDNLIRFVGEEIILEPKDDEVVVFKSFFRAGLRFLLYEMIGEVLKRFEIHLHQLTPNFIVRLSVIWALLSQGKSANAEEFCRVHELHYQTKAIVDGLHKNFGCYNFAYQKDTKAPVIGYRTKWPTGWTNEWFYVKTDEKRREKLMSMVMSPLKLSFDMMRPLCNMNSLPVLVSRSRIQSCGRARQYSGLSARILGLQNFSHIRWWGMPKKKDEGKKFLLVRLPYRFKFQKAFSGPCVDWLEVIETMCNEILSNYTKKEDQLMIAVFGTREKQRLNRVMNALGFEYPDYDRLDEEARGVKKKRVVSILKIQALRSVEDKKKRLSKRLKMSPEPSISKKRKVVELSRDEEEKSSPPKHSIETPSATSISVT